MIDFACEVVAPGASIHTDGARMFARLSRQGLRPPRTPGYKADDLDAVMPGPHLVSSLLKRWTAGTLHYRLSRQPPALLPRRVHLPVQPQKLQSARACCSTGCSSRPWTPTRIPSRSSSAAAAEPSTALKQRCRT